jgi:hypothetical protein
MPESRNTARSSPSDHSQQVSKWARRYAQNRGLGVVVSLVIFSLLFCAIGGTSYLAGQAYRSDNMPLFGFCLVLLVLALAANLYLAVPRWGSKLIARVTKRLYAHEGQVAISAPARMGQGWTLVLAVCFGGCIVASVLFGNRIPIEYRQPVMALYCVPFLTFLFIVQRPAIGFLALLWPFLFGLHAILIVAGVPIVFTGRWESLNFLVPVFGYGLLSAGAVHLYSRFALSRLKKLARGNESGHSPDDESASE